MKAIHVHWTKPWQYNNPGQAYAIYDFELFTALLSALKWREHNGSIQLYTDEQGLAFYHNLGLLDIWDGGYNTQLLEQIKNIDPCQFWAAGKLIAQIEQAVPYVMMDMDFIVWQPIAQQVYEQPLAAVHLENLSPVYLSKDLLHTPANYIWDCSWFWQVLPINGAWVYINDKAFHKLYIEQALKFMTNNVFDDGNRVSHMVFAEQHLFSILAYKCELPIYPLLNYHSLDTDNQQYTHIWGYKDTLKNDPAENISFCRKCLHRLAVDFPSIYQHLQTVMDLSPYCG